MAATGLFADVHEEVKASAPATTAMGAALPESAQAVVERIFGVMDADRNGQVDLAEMTGLLKRQAIFNNTFADEKTIEVAAVNQFKEIDTNGDGFIDRAELSAFLARQFRADAPADTVLQGLTDILHGYEEAMVAPPPPPPEAPRAADEEDDDVIPPPPGAR